MKDVRALSLFLAEAMKVQPCLNFLSQCLSLRERYPAPVHLMVDLGK